MKIYSVYHNKENDKFMMLNNSFSWVACIFNIAWLFYHKIWQKGLCFLIATLVMLNLQAHGVISSSFLQICNVLIMIYLGFAGNDIVEADQVIKGHKFIGIVIAENKDEAYLKCLNSFNKVQAENLI